MEQETKLCSNCSEEISAASTKCPYCGKNFKSWFKRHPMLTAIIIIFFVIPILSGFFSSFDTNEQSIPKEEVQEKKTGNRDQKLIGNVNFDGSLFHITNQEDRNWEMCLMTVNSKYQYPTEKGFMGTETAKLGKIEAGTTYSIGAMQFTLKDGTRFNPFQTKPKDFSIGCDNGFGYWGW